jgi:hypothetical protein
MTYDRTEFDANRAAGKQLQHARRIETREELRQRTRREVAEEIAAAIEDAPGQRGWPSIGISAAGECAHIAREIGARS